MLNLILLIELIMELFFFFFSVKIVFDCFVKKEKKRIRAGKVSKEKEVPTDSGFANILI